MLEQSGSAANLLGKFRNLVFYVPDLTDGEKFDKFVSYLNNKIRVEILRDVCANLDDASMVSLRIDSSISGVQTDSEGSTQAVSGTVPIKVGYMEWIFGDSSKRR